MVQGRHLIQENTAGVCLKSEKDNQLETKAYRQAPLWATQEKGEKMTSMFTYVESENSAKIKVIGVGGAGGNAINNMIASNLQGVKFISANTDAQALDVSQAELRMQLGTQITEGLGAGGAPRGGHGGDQPRRRRRQAPVRARLRRRAGLSPARTSRAARRGARSSDPPATAPR